MKDGGSGLAATEITAVLYCHRVAEHRHICRGDIHGFIQITCSFSSKNSECLYQSTHEARAHMFLLQPDTCLRRTDAREASLLLGASNSQNCCHLFTQERLISTNLHIQ